MPAAETLDLASAPGDVPRSETSVPDQTSAPAFAAPPDDLPDVHLDVELFYFERWMRVAQVVEMVNTSADSWDEVVFNVPIHYIPDTFYLDAMTVTLGDDVQEGTPSFPARENLLRVPMPRSVQSGEEIRIEMRYRIVVPGVNPTDTVPLGNTGWSLSVIQAGEWYPALVPYEEGVGWHTWEYHPVGDPTFYALTNTGLTIHTEPEVTVASVSPPEQDEDGTWHFQISGARGVAFLASDSYESVSGEVNGIPIISTYLPDHALAGEAALEIAAEAITLYEMLYGPYPYPSLTVAENGYFGSMEYSGLVSLTDYAYATYWGEPPSVLHVLTAHEIAHQWWYGAVGNDQANEPWLDEAFAFYSEFLYLEYYHPELGDWWWQNRVYQYNPHGPVDATVYSYADSDSFIFSMYGQAAQFMRDLRGLMGDEAFFTFVREYQAAYRWQVVTADDFFDAVRLYTGEDLAPLLIAYFADTDH